ncbi:MAG: leucine-rich repeat domain-containing protein [Bacteroidota bacterium]
MPTIQLLLAIMTRHFTLFILLAFVFFISCGQKKQEPKFMYFGLAEALAEKDPQIVSRLTLAGQNLNSIPEEVRGLTNLIDLDISSNQITKIPSWLTELKKLERLNLRVNPIDTLSQTFFDLKNLADLDLWGCKLQSIPSGFGRMKRLKGLNLGANNLDKLPEDISGLDSLTFLSLDLNKFKTVPKVIFALTSLENVHLYNNQISEVSDSISKLKMLGQLTIDNNCLTLRQFNHLKGLLPNCLMGEYNPAMNNCK